MTAFDEGIEAWCDDECSDMNPYTAGTREFSKWVDGYYSIATLHEDETYERSLEISREMAMDACDMTLEGRDL